MMAMEARPRSERRAVAASRIEGTAAALAHCEMCVQRCGVDRRRGPAGIYYQLVRNQLDLEATSVPRLT